MKINVHAGHNADGKMACGSIGFIRESTEARLIKDAVIGLLRQMGHTAYDCTVDNASGVNDNLRKIVANCNSREADLDVSIHLNSWKKEYAADGKTKGVEVYINKPDSKAKAYAEQVCAAIADLGFSNRGVKVKSYYVLRNTKAPAMLVECCFVDDKDDVQLYDYQAMAEAIVFGITGQRVQNVMDPVDKDPIEPDAETPIGDAKQLYRVQVGAYFVKGNADAQMARLKEAGFDAIVVKA